ncbi:uncharacterized protein K489DRAFT_380477 [Dissoconium aciculare CBS 342.82]|uniref:Uncharacterized protein n=1 Tax=Dissoconium aciculare CBS 342.82 TaxID=1314786 RepID=A0A6J3M6E4_9PEZI|nr:uncharacterized protein K489DRAFT_380477 [Dissoconium aciculare CBS 342.82]KAF1823089.1 hypothetical protein K489DRAFT_380477 [Dissoconium aciculare CBS 342.82]
MRPHANIRLHGQLAPSATVARMPWRFSDFQGSFTTEELRRVCFPFSGFCVVRLVAAFWGLNSLENAESARHLCSCSTPSSKVATTASAITVMFLIIITKGAYRPC